MILRRLGNKKKIAKEIQKHFPPHKIYIEPFFGAGGMFFNKPKAKYNIVNDLDSDVFNLFQVVMNQKEELEEAFYIMPIHSDLLDYWKENKEDEPIRKALRFLFLSNLTFLGKQDTIQMGLGNTKTSFYTTLKTTYDLINDVKFSNKDFRKFISSLAIGFKNDLHPDETFVYSDSPYLSTVDTYSDSDTWNEQDSLDLFSCLEETKCKWAMSEFDHPFIIDQAQKRGLNIIYIGERQNLKNRRTEILVTNYENRQHTLF
ncbi:DNA adenine methylase [Winogradskyella pulchriflava]|uniref:DNA adenine methylase n=1 Tax=Winogradskyella pulchriflava TaxID=1110688 RepID=A0ABV6QC69_9FLAO